VLAVEQHRRLVLLALADHHDAVEVDRAEELAHRIHGRAVGAELVTLADERHRADRGRLGRAHEFEREVPIGVQEQRAGFGRCQKVVLFVLEGAVRRGGDPRSDRRSAQPTERRASECAR
jgi:hypothetical protein